MTAKIQINQANTSYSPQEEAVNAISHGIAALLSVLALILMIYIAKDSFALTSAIIYGASLIALFTSSTFYHSISRIELKPLLKQFDHCAIYLLIAGTYTPFMLISLKGVWGYTILSVVWSLAIFGIYFKLKFKHRFPKISLLTYLAMGWLILIATPEMLEKVATEGLILLAAGGVAYSLGAVFYTIKKIPFNHAIWHIFVLLGSGCHFFAIYFYVFSTG